MHATVMEARTGVADPQEGQAVNYLGCMTNHPPERRQQDLLPHVCTVVEEINDNIVFFIILCIHPRQRHQEQHCGGQQPD